MFDFNKHLEPLVTEALPNQVENSTGGFVYSATDQLKRFLILGTEGGTYYINERKLTRDNVKSLQKSLDSDYVSAINTIVDISKSGRCIKNDTCIYALAVASAHSNVVVRKYALDRLQDVCRTGTHLFQFMEYIKPLRGRGRLLKQALQRWYLSKPNDKLEYQLVKYQSRNGWSHRDVLRLCKPVSADKNNLFKWAVGKADSSTVDSLTYIKGFEKAKSAVHTSTIQELIYDFNLTREMLPTQWLNNPAVWDFLIHNTPYIAMIRNLGVMSACEYLKPMSSSVSLVRNRITDAKEIKDSKIHPVQLLMAWYTYRHGRGLKGSLSWSVDQTIVAALEDAFYLSFGNVKSTGKNVMIALDVSGSMTFKDLAGIPDFTPHVASAVLAMATVRSEPNCYVYGFSRDFIPIDINRNTSLDGAIKAVSNLPFSITNMSLPIKFAIDNKFDVDAFVIYTDNEVNSGKHPSLMLKKYRKIKPTAKMAVVAMTSNGFTVSDPNDPLMCDFVGFDTSTPQAIGEFINL